MTKAQQQFSATIAAGMHAFREWRHTGGNTLALKKWIGDSCTANGAKIAKELTYETTDEAALAVLTRAAGAGN